MQINILRKSWTENEQICLVNNWFDQTNYQLFSGMAIIKNIKPDQKTVEITDNNRISLKIIVPESWHRKGGFIQLKNHYKILALKLN